uniref:Uncharacterized protein n=1 Tax=Poecilia reticulata TaxID=8081 RepID=A0A3P9QHR1_POERE
MKGIMFNPPPRIRENAPTGGGPPRSRKSRFRAPDVRTIFSPGEKDPRVKEETGEGHTFEPGGENNWCDVCCNYILQHGLTCAGKTVEVQTASLKTNTSLNEFGF